MKFTFLKSKKFWLKSLGLVIFLICFLFTVLLSFIYVNQEELINSEIKSLNQNYEGQIKIGEVHLEPFKNFPYISIRVDDVRIFETKLASGKEILNVQDIYLGFNITDLLLGKYDIKNLIIEDGFFNIIIHKDGLTNIQNALSINSNSNQEDDPIDIHLQNIILKNLDIHKLDEKTNIDIETYIYNAKGGFKNLENTLKSHVDTDFELNVINNHDTTYINKKQFEVQTDLVYDKKSGLLSVEPSGIKMEHGDFDIYGTMDMKNDLFLDLDVSGTKPNFNMLIAFAPSDVIPILERYKNAGKIYFNATIKGSTLNGNMPLINASFGASEAFLENTEENKRIENMGFKGHFTNGEDRNLKSMEFSLEEMTAKLEAGEVSGSIFVKDFVEPEVDMYVNADFDLDFISRFLNLKEIKAKGNVSLDMQFHNIIDFVQPETTLNQLNKAYYSEIKFNDLSIYSVNLKKPIEHFNVHAFMSGDKAVINEFNLDFGTSDLSIAGFISDLPAIVHCQNTSVSSHLEIKSSNLDFHEICELYQNDNTMINEQVKDLNLDLTFNTLARNVTDFEYLPKGEFVVEKLNAQLKHYPHKFHDFNARIKVKESDINIFEFKGEIDNSDFSLKGNAYDYKFWFADHLNGDVKIDLSLFSKELKLQDLFVYKGENYVPKEYRHEQFDNLQLHFLSDIEFKNSKMQSVKINLDQLNTKMKLHPLRFQNFSGSFEYQNEFIKATNIHGRIGKSVFDVDLNYFFDKTDSTIKDNFLKVDAEYIDFDEIFAFKFHDSYDNSISNKNGTNKGSYHSQAFNIYNLPFPSMNLDVDIRQFIYHRLDLRNIKSNLRTTQNHFLYVDKLTLDAAGGSMALNGYFNASNPEEIYLKPDLKLKNVDIDKLLFKFENFGQDAFVSDNLHGKISANVNGKILMYPDMVPNIDKSEIHMDVIVLDGRLENYKYMQLLSDYMGDKDLNLIRFDTLQNHIDLYNGNIKIPNMSIESTLGHFELSGSQDMKSNVEYYFKIPWSVIKEAGKYKLFGDKKSNEENKVNDEIVKINQQKKNRYLNLKIKGNTDKYKITLSKKK
ncbi:MAG: hypothetical protein CL844_03980 [Crocinitomicaceae bacterium]|nr:hypothetical protein [Crocinitomicaceae bacterium]|tara:strand:+ start:7116 stop:10313 length:3198 start_codon:yes stop_codon:yes gene_type:complete